MLPVVHGEKLVGAVTEEVLAQALLESDELTDPVGDVAVACETIHPYETGAEVLRRGIDTLIVVDDAERVLGLISPSDLWPRPRVAAQPSSVGGMATPFGVYLTAGTVRAGASGPAMMALGATMFLLMFGGFLAARGLVHWAWDAGFHSIYLAQAFGIVPLLVFLLLMRILPISGTHGAEHQVVHAIERGEDLEPEVVARMPLVHPRCGTNFGAAIGLFLSTFLWEWTHYEELRLLVAALVTAFFWRPVGTFLQRFVTTKKPTPKQLEGAIRVGKELLDRYAVARLAYANPWQRIVQSGMLWVLAGSTLTGTLSALLLIAFGYQNL